MLRKRQKFEVFVDLDPVPGTFHSVESAQNVLRRIIFDMIPHYNPIVSVARKDVAEVDGSDLTVMCYALRKTIEQAPEDSLEHKSLTNLLAKLIDLNTLADYKLQEI